MEMNPISTIQMVTMKYIRFILLVTILVYIYMYMYNLYKGKLNEEN